MNVNIIKLENTDISIDIKEISELYLKGNYSEICNIFLKIFRFLDKIVFKEISENAQYFIDSLVESFLFYITKPYFIIESEMAVAFILLNPIITNIIAISSFKNTDSWISILMRQSNSVIKLMILYSSRNTIKLNKSYFFDFDHDSNLASLWYGSYFDSASSWQNKTVYENMNQHLEFWDNRIILNSVTLSNGYMISTYISPYKDRIYKQNFNYSASETLKNITIRNNPDKKKIAIISGSWVPNHVVMRNYFKYVETLKDDYDLTLISLDYKNLEDTSFFKEVIYLSFENIQRLDFSSILNNNFIMAFYIDVGMEPVSRYLSNLRIAPIQLMAYGHSASTFGSLIDYIVGGADSEDINKVQDYYSEKMILIPGLGINLEKPDYRLMRKAKPDNSVFIINCSWGIQKLNYPLIETLRKILDKSDKKIKFRFFCPRPLHNSLLVLKNDLESILSKDSVEIISFLNEPKYYLEILEEGDIGIDSFPFGGINTVIDNLYLEKPIITWKGWQFNNTAGSSLLEKLGLQILVANNEDEYINKVIKLINDDLFRLNIQKKIKQIDFDTEFKKLDFRNSFKKAIDNLITDYLNI